MNEENVKEITIPYNFTPREYQLPLFEAMDSGIKRAVLAYHRRGGKDLACWNLMLKKAMERVANYYYIFPEYSQARKSFWDNITEDGVRFLDFCPKAIVKKILNHEVKMKRTASLVREYVRELSDDNLNDIVQKWSQKLGGDYANLAYLFQRNRAIDDLLRSAQSAEDWFDLVDFIGEAANRELKNRGEPVEA